MINCKKNSPVVIILITILFYGTVFAQSNDIPGGWIKAGSNPKGYVIKVNKKMGQNGENIVSIKSIKGKVNGFGTLMQYFSAEKYLNKRVRFSASVKSVGVVSWAGLWMRIDDRENPPNSVAFDNMRDRPILGSSDWKYYNIVLDVPPKANLINIGVLLNGRGELLLSNLKFEVVNKSIPVTNPASALPSAEPQNLDFDK